MADDTTTEESSAKSTLKTALDTILASKKLTENGKLFYGLDFLWADDTLNIEGTAGLQVFPGLKVGSTLQYNPLTGKFSAGLSLGGEVTI